jgi:hypothetical protein
MNLKELKAELRRVASMENRAQWDFFEEHRARNAGRKPSLVEAVIRAIGSGTEDFGRELAELPPWTLRYVRARGFESEVAS